MIDYSIHMVARQEHEYMVQSLAPASDYPALVQPRQAGWAVRLAGRLLNNVGQTLTDVGKHIGGDESRTALDPSLHGQLGQPAGLE